MLEHFYLRIYIKVNLNNWRYIIGRVSDSERNFDLSLTGTLFTADW